jgi:Tfp pilus assembly protein PilF/AAA+ ATPase superfamily predicted ATPase
MHSPFNPYIANKPVGNTPAFIGRADRLREVERMLHSPDDNAIVLYGQRHIGKSSLLQHLTAQLPTYGNYYPIYFDLQDKATWSLDKLVNELAKNIAHALDQAVPDLGDQPEAEFIEILPKLLQSLPKKTALVLLFDEFEVLPDLKDEQAGAAFFPYLHQLVSIPRQTLKFIFAMGRDVEDIDNMTVYLFRDIPPIKRLSLLNQKETEKLVRLSEANKSLNWQEEAVTSVWRYTQGHPFLTQQICFHVWEHAHNKAPKTAPTVTPTDVENVIFEVLEASRKTLEWLWDGLPPAGRVVASALAEGGPMTEQALETWFYENGIRVFIQELQDTPRLLQNWDWLKLTDDAYAFHVELLRRWVKKNKPFRRIQDQVDAIDPVADRLFKTAIDFYKKEDFDSSIKDLREAIGLNPNHMGAHQLLADILLAQGKPREAKQLLEKLYNYKPQVARSRLIQALLDLAQETKDEAQKIEWYEQVLKLDPKQPEAIAGRRQIWQQRAEKALAKKDFREALKFYKKLGITQKVADIVDKIDGRYSGIEKEYENYKKKKRYQIWALTILVLVFGIWAIWAYWIQPSPQQSENAKLEKAHLEGAFEQLQAENTRLEGRVKQALEEKVLLEQKNEQLKGKYADLEKALEQASKINLGLQQKIFTLYQRSELGKFMSKLEKGHQIVVVSSFTDRQSADRQLKKLKAAHPELFYPQDELLPAQVENNIYQRGKLWEIFVSGFYSYKSANSLKRKIIKLDLIKSAFIRNDPFRDRRQLPWL